MRRHISRSLLLGLVVLFIAGSVWYEAAQLPDMATDLAVVDAAFFPRVIAVLLAALAVSIMWSGRANTQDRISLVPTPKFCKVVAFVGLVIAYNICLPLGFEIVSPLFVLCGMLLLGARNRLVLMFLPIVTTAVIYFVFIKIMYVPLPSIL